MAAFSSHHDHHCPPSLAPELGDVPNTSKKMSDLLKREMMKTTTGFSPIYPSKYPPLQFHSIHEISFGSIDSTIKPPLSYAQCGMTPKQYTDSSSVVAQLQSTSDADQSTLALTHSEKKRKSMHSKVVGEDQCKKLEKKCEDGMSRNGEEKKFKARGNEKKKKKKKKVPKEPPTGCVHVRARKGQATDSHSLAERARREKISERMRLLQSLVPGCDKITGKALILDEIINYVQSLKNQVEFLVMKLDATSLMSSDLDDNVSASEFCKLELPLPSVPEYIPMELGVGTSIPETTPISTSFLHHQDQRSTFPSQDDDGDLLGAMIIDDQRQMLIANHSGLNNLCYF